MKTNLLKSVILMAILGLPLMNFAQWNVNNTWNDRWGKTVDLIGSDIFDIRRIGIGNFILSGYGGPRAALHVNENLLTDLVPGIASNYYTPGHLFRTDGPLDQDNMWQLFTGPDASATEKARFYVPANSIDLVLQASAGSLLFNTNGNNTQMKLDTNGFLTINTLATGNNTLILANKNGTLVPTNIENLIAQSITIIELKKQITELQAQVKELLLANKN